MSKEAKKNPHELGEHVVDFSGRAIRFIPSSKSTEFVRGMLHGFGKTNVIEFREIITRQK